MTINLASVLIAFYAGAIMGSFASAIVNRLNQKDSSFWTGRSRCSQCHKQLSWIDLIPILSYLIRKGRCRQCKKAFGAHYLAYELVLGLLFILPILNSNWSPAIVAASYFFIFVGFLIAIYDLKYQLIPDIFSVLWIIGGAVLGTVGGISWQLQLTGALAVGGFFGIQWLISNGRWIGSGDILLGIGMGLAFGWQLGLVALLLSYIFGSFVAIALLANKRANRKSSIAFGPFLMVGSLITLFLGEQILNWYLSTQIFLIGI